MKKLANKIETYQVTNSIYVDAVEERDNNEDVLSFWLYHKDYGNKMLMIGIKKDDIGTGKTWESVEDIIIQEIEDSVVSYYADYIEQDDALQAYSTFFELSEEFSNEYDINFDIKNFVSIY
jgi:hypothetical protein